MHLNVVIGLIYCCVWFTSTGASSLILILKPVRCTLCCVVPRCGQKRLRNVAYSVSHRGLLMTVVQIQEWLEWRSLIAFAAEHQPLSTLGLFAFYVQRFSDEEFSGGGRMEQVNDPEK